jgi:hygromycin-B 7''-O-kinase
MRLKLPVITSAADYQKHFDASVWSHVASEICARHKISHTSLRRSPQGENIIFFVDSRFVIKIFAPFRDNYRREKAALEFAATHKFGIETPDILHTGEIDGWSYLVMSQLAGEALREAWARVGRRDRFEIVSRLGKVMRELHNHAAPLSQSALNRNWRAFIEHQAGKSIERQTACGANPEWLESLPAYIAARFELLPANSELVFLHGDIHAGNLLLAERNGRWQITGLLDFGDSLCGFHEYEFVAPGVLMVQGDRELQREMLLAYGYSETQLDIELRSRLMLLTVLYECSDLRKYAMRLAPEAIHLRLDELERAIWRFAD